MSLFRLKYPNAKKGNVPGKALSKLNALFSYVNSPDKIVFFFAFAFAVRRRCIFVPK